MRKYEILFVISMSALFCDVTSQTNEEKSEHERKHNMRGKLFNEDLILGRTEASVLKRIARQTGYNYDKPKVPFDLPKNPTEATVSVTPRPGPAPSNPAGDYSYPSPPNSVPPPPISRPQGYETSRPVTPVVKQDDSYEYKAPSNTGTSTGGSLSNNIGSKDNSYEYKAPSNTGTSTGGSLSNNKGSKDGSYSYDAPFNPVGSSVPSSQVLETVISSTGGPTYLPPKPSSAPSGSLPSALYKQPNRVVDVSIPSSTPGEPYLPPKIASPAANPQPAFNAPSSSPVRNPSSSYGTPPRGPIKVANSYLAPKGNPPPMPKTPGNSYVPPQSGGKPPGASYVPPSPSGFQPSESTSPRPQITSVSTPAMSYLPPYN